MLRFFLFGSPHFEDTGAAVPLRHSKPLALLAYLALSDQPRDRDTLLALLWPEFDASSARNNLRRELSHSKAVLGVELLGQLLASAPGVRLLVTSREALKLQEEWLHSLHGLETLAAAGGDVAGYSALQCFVVHGSHARPACRHRVDAAALSITPAAKAAAARCRPIQAP